MPGRLGAKKKVRELASFLGVRTPELLHSLPIKELLTSKLPDEFVLKPEFASTSIGVHLLRRVDEGYEKLTDGQQITEDELIAKCQDISQRFLNDPDAGLFLAEELLRDPDGNTPPQDVRFYSFQGTIGMILMEHHLPEPTRASYFDGNFLPFADVHDRYGVAEGSEHLEQIVESPPPENWQALLNVARRISYAIPTAFCRIDLYDTSKGVALGEVTFYPGTFFYRNRKIMKPAEAHRLGRLWQEAEARLTGSIEYR